MPSHANSSFYSRNPLQVDIEMKNLNLQVTLLQCKKKCGNGIPTPLHHYAYEPMYSAQVQSRKV